MAVDLKYPFGATLAFALMGCAGNVLAGLPLDGGETEPVVEVPVVDAGRGDARVPSASTDAGTNVPVVVRDAQTVQPTPVADTGVAAPNDAGAPPAVPVDAGVVAPPSGSRDFGTDKVKFAGAPRCGDAKAAFCDDFESQAPGALPGQAWGYPYDFRPKIDTAHAMRGKNALYFESAASIPAHVEVTQTFPALSGNLFGRMFVWIDELPTMPNTARWNLVALRGPSNDTEVRLGGQIEASRDNKNFFGVGSDYGESGTWQTSGKEAESTVRQKDWICVEWQFKSDTSESNVWIDGAEQKSLHLTATEYRDGDAEAGKQFKFPTFDKLRIGWWLYQGNATPSPSKVWIDEVVFDKARIGCVL